VKIIIKFPNWYEHFQANGYDLDQEPKIFDGIYTGTETRDPVTTDQHLQQYESYQIVRYFDNISAGRNGGGWVDTYDTRYLDRYAEQLWDTMLAKAPQIVLFQYSDLLKAAESGRPQGVERPRHQLHRRGSE
jgi:glutathione S-transferase